MGGKLKRFAYISLKRIGSEQTSMQCSGLKPNACYPKPASFFDGHLNSTRLQLHYVSN